MNQQDSLPGPHPHRGIFISLVIAIILLLGVFGFFVYSAFFMTTEEPAVVDDGQATMIEDLEEQVADLEGQLEEAQQEAEPRYFDGFVSFDYPDGWHVASIADRTEDPENTTRNLIIGSSNPIAYPSFGPPYLLDARLFHNETADFQGSASLTEWMTGNYVSELLETEMETTTINGFQVTRFFGNFNDGPSPGPIDTIVFEGETQSAFVRHSGDIENADWEFIKNSLDFSNVE